MYYAIVEIKPEIEELRKKYIDGYIVFFINFRKEDVIDELIRFYIKMHGWCFIQYEETPTIVKIEDFCGDDNVKALAFKEALIKGYSYVLYSRKKISVPKQILVFLKRYLSICN